MAVLTAVTRPVPKRRTIRADMRLDTMVPAEQTIDTAPAMGSAAPSSTRMVGHAAPSSESGSPREINAI